MEWCFSYSHLLPMGASSSGALLVGEGELEFVKVKKYNGSVRSTAMVSVDGARLLFEGPLAAPLFGVSEPEWAEIEALADEELFYRRFKLGLNGDFPPAQTIFYNFCEVRFLDEPVHVHFTRTPNMRKNEKTHPFLKVIKCELIKTPFHYKSQTTFRLN